VRIKPDILAILVGCGGTSERSLFEFQFAFNNCIRLIFIGMQSGPMNPASGPFTRFRERKCTPANQRFRTNFRRSPVVRDLTMAWTINADNKSRRRPSCSLPIRANNNGFKSTPLENASDFENTSVRSATFFGSSMLVYFVKREEGCRELPSGRVHPLV
jgi:hypothetical protein